MKSERGVTVASIMIYLVAFTMVVIAVGRITSYFYKNMDHVTSDATSNSEYIKFNTYFTEEINIEGNEVELCEKSYIVFSKTKNQYTYQNGSLYRGKSKISKDVEFCEFYYDKSTKEIYVNLKIQGKTYSSTYTVAK